MAESFEKVEEGWWLRFLWRPKATKRSRVDIADTVLIDNGMPNRWLFTSKDGEVKKKGEEKTGKFHETFLKVASADRHNPRKIIAVTRGPDGKPAVHDLDQFKSLISGGIGSYVAVQRYISMKGGDGSLYRTQYEVVNDTGHTVCTTSKLTKVLNPDSSPAAQDHLAAVRSLDRSLNTKLESIAKRVIRDLEDNSRVRVIHATLDFILPAVSPKPVLIWVGAVNIVQGEAAADLRKAGLMSEGDRYFNFLSNKRRTKDELAQPLQRGPTSTGLKPRKPSDSGLEQAANTQLADATSSLLGSRPKSPPKSPVKGHTSKLAASMSTLDASDRLSAALTLHATDMGGMKEAALPEEEKEGENWFHVSVLDSVGGKAAPWCAGSYCNCRLKDPAAIRSLSAMDIAREFFPAEDLTSLAGDLDVPPAAAVAAAAVQSQGSVAKQWRPEQGYVLSKRSIVLAQQDLEQRRKASGSSKEEEKVNGLSRAMAPTSSTKLRTSWAARRGDVAGGLGNYYQEVKVCPTCYLVYTTLDRARSLLQEKEAQRAKDSVLTLNSSTTTSFDGSISLVPGEKPGKPRAAKKRLTPVTRGTRAGGKKAGKKGQSKGWASKATGVPRRAKANSTTSLHLTSLSSTGTGSEAGDKAREAEASRFPRVRSAGDTGLRDSSVHTAATATSDSLLEDPSADDSMVFGGRSGKGASRQQGKAAAREQRRAEREKAQRRYSPVRVASKERSVIPEYWAASETHTATAKAKLDKPSFQSSISAATLATHEKLDEFLRGNAVNPSQQYPEDRVKSFLEEMEGDPEEEHLKAQAAEAEAKQKERRERERAAIEAEWQGFLEQTWGEDAGKGAEPEGNGWRGAVLVVEHESDVGVSAARALATAGYAVYAADDGPKALTLTRSLPLDAVVVASELPSLNGADISRIIRQREERAAAVASAGGGGSKKEEGPHIPILALSAYQEEADLKSFMEAGMDGCIAKPIHVPSLLQTMDEAVPYPPEGKPADWGVWVAGYTSQPMCSVGRNAAAAAREVEFGDSLNPLPAAPGSAAADAAARVSSASASGGFVVPGYALDNEAGRQEGGGSGANGGRRRSSKTGKEKDKDMSSAPFRSSLPAISPVHGASSGTLPPPAARQQAGGSSEGSSNPLASIAHLGYSSTSAAASMDKASASERAARGRTLRLSDGTSVPFLVLGRARKGAPLFNLVVVHDFFDNLDAWQVLLAKTIDKYPGLQVLLFNVAGQANTSWPPDAILNNEFQAAVMQQVLLASGRDGSNARPDSASEAQGSGLKRKGARFVGSVDGPKECEPFAPCTKERAAWFYVLGVGNGGNIATMWASDYSVLFPNLRGIVTVNSFLYMDPQLSAAMHDCANVFACTPSSRPDLPLYFFSRFLFSQAYIKKVGAPMALNIYTAVANPITIEGRIKIAQGALAHKDLRRRASDILQPLICITTDKSALVNSRVHSEAILAARQGEERSVRECLHKDGRVCLVWFRGGHEVVQECRFQFLTFVEQLVSGYHENNDVAYLPLLPDTPEAANTNFPHSASVASGPTSASTRGPGPHRKRGSGARNTKAERAVNRAMARAQALAAELDEAELYGSHSSLSSSTRRRGKGGKGGRKASPAAPEGNKLFEDHFLDTVVSTLRSHETLPQGTPQASPITPFGHGPDTNSGSGGSSGGGATKKKGKRVRLAPSAGEEGDPEVVMLESNNGASVAEAPSLHMPSALQGPPSQGFVAAAPQQRRTTAAAGAATRSASVLSSSAGSAAAPVASMAKHVPEVREYMSWRIRRNKKRLERIENCAIMIQRCWRAYLARTLVTRMRFQKAALDVQRWWRGILGRRAFNERKRMVWAALLVQRNYRGHRDRVRVYRMQLEEAAARDIQRVYRGYAAKKWVRGIHEARRSAATQIQALLRKKLAQKVVWRRRQFRHAATQIQRVWRGRLGRARALRERDRFLFSKAQSQGIEFGRQMLMEHKMQATKLQSEVSLLTQEKIKVEEEVEEVLREIATFEAGVRSLEKEMVELSRAEAEAAGMLDSEAKVELRENKMRLDREFGAMLVKIADRREKLKALEGRLASIERARQAKKEDLKDLERKLVVLLEEQQTELEQIKQRQERRGERHVPDAVAEASKASGGATDVTRQASRDSGNGSGTGGGSGGPTPQERAEANALMASTETMMKFGFMSMSMTYFSSLNMIRAMRKVGTANTVLANPLLQNAAAMQAQLGGGGPAALAGGLQQQVRGFPGTAADFKPKLQAGALPGQENTMNVQLWTVADVGAWLESLSLGQYKDSFADAAVDGAFLYDLTDEDLKNTLGIEHGLHRKKILNAVKRLRRSDPSLMASSQPSPLTGGPSMPSSGFGSPSFADGSAELKEEEEAARKAEEKDKGPEPSIDKLISWARHGKGKKLSDYLRGLPNVRFDPESVETPYLEGFGTQYDSSVPKVGFHINAVDKFGNTMLIAACQNGHKNIASLLIRKGANPNHQNNQGQTALHFAMSYNFHELGSWLVDEDGGRADDGVLNRFGLGPYDGLQPEGQSCTGAVPPQ